MSGVGWDSFEVDEAQVYHQRVSETLNGYMETGHHAEARVLLEEYGKEHPLKADVLRLSLVRKFGTGL